MSTRLETGLDVSVLGGIPTAALLGLLPHLSAIVSLVYALVKLYETDTVQRWLARRRDARKFRKRSD